jgi:GTP-binding protein
VVEPESHTGAPAPDEAPRRPLPRIAIVGRPNVGKSTLLNRLCGSRVAIVEPTAGVTRDRVAVRALLGKGLGVDERMVEVIDTGGIGVVDRDDLGPRVEEQVRVALSGADIVLFVVDSREGVTPLDVEVATRLRGADVPLFLLANKAEGEKNMWEVDSFRSLGVETEPIAISAQNGEGITGLIELLLERLEGLVGAPAGDAVEEVAPSLRIAVVGRRNAGKSTLINAFAREERMIVSEIPGTTRDAVDVLFERDGETFVVIDTAGIRKKKSIADAIEFYSDARTHKAVRRADAVILLFDATEDLSSIEKRLARYVVDQYKPVILAANKWDTVGRRMDLEKLQEYVNDTVPGLRFAPLVRLSALRGRGVHDLLTLVKELAAESAKRVGTGELNRVLERALAARSPSSAGHRVRVMYATQADESPPTFVLFVNDKKLIGKNYLRYLENRLREELCFPRVPIRIVLRDRSGVPTEEG